MASISENKYFYEYDDINGNNERTKQRLIEIEKLGLIELGNVSFGIPGLMSGLYIERVWYMNDEKWIDYINWIKELKIEKNK